MGSEGWELEAEASWVGGEVGHHSGTFRGCGAGKECVGRWQDTSFATVLL
jgi:hypothetical protein